MNETVQLNSKFNSSILQFNSIQFNSTVTTVRLRVPVLSFVSVIAFFVLSSLRNEAQLSIVNSAVEGNLTVL